MPLPGAASCYRERTMAIERARQDRSVEHVEVDSNSMSFWRSRSPCYRPAVDSHGATLGPPDSAVRA